MVHYDDDELIGQKYTNTSKPEYTTTTRLYLSSDGRQVLSPEQPTSD
jgi:hypothetical protein